MRRPRLNNYLVWRADGGGQADFVDHVTARGAACVYAVDNMRPARTARVIYTSRRDGRHPREWVVVKVGKRTVQIREVRRKAASAAGVGA